jgi:spore coat protein U-like protein
LAPKEIAMSNRIARLVLATAIVFAAVVANHSGTASAASRTSTVTVTTTVPASCNINAATLAFAAYDPVNTHATAADDATGTITVRCTKGATGITIDLGAGSNNSGSQRQMVHASDPGVLLSYEIYKESSHSSVWGTGDSGTVYSGSTLDGTGADVQVTMYGRIPAAQLQAIAGSYSDTVVSTINF